MLRCLADTIEEGVRKLQDHKLQVSQSIVCDTSNGQVKFSNRDVDFLLDFGIKRAQTRRHEKRKRKNRVQDNDKGSYTGGLSFW